jgi:hypothetical protein
MPRRDFIHRVLAVRSQDPILHHIAPLGLAAGAGRCLVIDLDRSSPGYSKRTLAELVGDGIRSADLETRSGVAVLGNGGVSFTDAAPTIDRLLTVWGRVVFRDGGDSQPFRVLQIEPLLPDPFPPDLADVVQATAPGQTAGGRPLLPPLRRHQIRAMLAGTIEPRWRWTRAWHAVWSTAWE